MPEDRRLIPNLTVEENILSPTWVVPMPDSAARLDRIYDVIEELKPLKRLPASALSGGQQKLAALARALLVGRKLLLLDEPTEGVAPVLAARLGDILNDMRASDTAILVAESNDTVFANLFDRECRLERGVLNPVRTGGDSAA
jgi:branched-chain amino acid transport system ATP-binding protein